MLKEECHENNFPFSKSELFLSLNLLGQIDGINSGLKLFASNSEKTFLNIGQKLQLFLNDSRNITESASQISSTISSEILQKGISNLEFSLNEISTHLAGESEKISGDKSELLKTYLRLENIGVELDGFDKIVKRLRMLGISTKIESSRLSLEDAGFFTLAENVDRLSNIISEKIALIKKQSNYLLTELNKTVRELDQLECKQRGQSEIVLNKTAHSLNSFKERSRELSLNAGRISDLSRGVTQNMGGIVSAIQFHDITRQQMEHSCESLNELRSRIYDEQNSDEYNKTFWGTVYDVYNLQSIQLTNSLNDFVRAVNNIVNNLSNVEENISSILLNSLELNRSNEKGRGTGLDIFEEELTQISTGLTDNLKIGGQVAVSIKSIISIVDDLSTYVTEIEEVGSEIEIIALNARVKAAHFGSNGSALGVLAESIQILSLEAKQQTVSTADILNGIISRSEKLRSDLESETDESRRSNVMLAVQKINDLLNSIKSVERDTNAGAENLRTDVNKLKSKIENAKHEVSIHEDAKINIGQIISELNKTSQILKNNLDLKSNRSQNTMDIYARYTMQSERKIHENFANNEKRTGAVTPEQKKSDENSFGDNVELF